MAIRFDDTTELERFWGGASGPAAAGATEFAILVTLDTGVAAGKALISLPRCVYSSITTQPSGRDPLIQTVTGKAYLSTIALASAANVSSEILISLFNANTTVL